MNKRDTDKIKKIGPNVERLWLYCSNNEMKANRVLYKLKSINTNANEENKQVPCMKLFPAILLYIWDSCL